MVTLAFFTLSQSLQQKNYLEMNFCTGPRALVGQVFTSQLWSDSTVGAIDYHILLIQCSAYYSFVQMVRSINFKSTVIQCTENCPIRKDGLKRIKKQKRLLYVSQRRASHRKTS